MHESRTWPRFLPRLFKPITIHIGSPIDPLIEPLLIQHRQKFPVPWRPDTYGREVEEDMREEPAGLKESRGEIAEVLRQSVMRLGQLEAPSTKG